MILSRWPLPSLHSVTSFFQVCTQRKARTTTSKEARPVSTRSSTGHVNAVFAQDKRKLIIEWIMASHFQTTLPSMYNGRESYLGKYLGWLSLFVHKILVVLSCFDLKILKLCIGPASLKLQTTLTSDGRRREYVTFSTICALDKDEPRSEVPYVGGE